MRIHNFADKTHVPLPHRYPPRKWHRSYYNIPESLEAIRHAHCGTNAIALWRFLAARSKNNSDKSEYSMKTTMTETYLTSDHRVFLYVKSKPNYHKTFTV